jgi:hypothetical protein
MKKLIPITEGSVVSYRIEESSGIQPVEAVAPAVYRIVVSDRSQVHLVHDRDRFTMPSKFYGAHQEIVQDVLQAISSTEASVGVLLVGEKGNGKSLCMEDLANHAIDAGRPVLRITNAVPKEVLTYVHQTIGAAAFMFDEFATTYFEAKHRNELIDFFSDKAMVNCLFLVAQGDEQKIPSDYQNRPGRFLFRIKVSNPSPAVIEEIVTDLNINPKLHDTLVEYCVSAELNMDSIRSVIETTNRIPVEHNDQRLRATLSRMNIPQPKLKNVTIQLQLAEVDFNWFKDHGFTAAVNKSGDIYTVMVLDQDQHVAWQHSGQLRNFTQDERIVLNEHRLTITIDNDVTHVDSVADHVATEVKVVIKEVKSKKDKKRDERSDNFYSERDDD